MRLMRREEVAELLGVSPAMINKLRNTEATFPDAVMIAPRLPAWWDHEITAWLEKRRERRPEAEKGAA